MRKTDKDSKILKLMKARKMIVDGLTIEEVSEEIKLDINTLNILRDSMIANLKQLRNDMDSQIFDALHEDNMLYLEIS